MKSENRTVNPVSRSQMPGAIRERLMGLAAASGPVAVVGSMNADYTVTTRRLPEPGETVKGGPLRILPGGKGANQAAAAARLGADVRFYGAVGDDANASFLLSRLDEAGVDTSEVLHTEGASGTTVITVDAEGENTIVYSAGANTKASAGYVQCHREALGEASVLGLCLESPIPTVIAAAQAAYEQGVTVLLNESPFMAQLPHELVEATDVILVNEHEAAELLEMPGLVDGLWTTRDWTDAAARLTDYGFARGIVTLGDEGSIVVEDGGWTHVGQAIVDAVDTTGCGDSFMGTVLAGLAAGYPLAQCAHIGSYVAAYAACGLGAQSSYGTARQVADYFTPAQ